MSYDVGDIVRIHARDTVRFEGKDIQDALKITPCTFNIYGKIIGIQDDYVIVTCFETDDPHDENNDGYAVPIGEINKVSQLEVVL